MSQHLTLSVQPEKYCVARLPAGSPLPAGLRLHPFSSITSTRNELSLIVTQDNLVTLDDNLATVDANWRVFHVVGQLDFSLTGITSAITSALTNVGVSSLTVATYDTDYFFVKADDLRPGLVALEAAGYTIEYA